jgi:hypothetical protein
VVSTLLLIVIVGVLDPSPPLHVLPFIDDDLTGLGLVNVNTFPSFPSVTGDNKLLFEFAVPLPFTELVPLVLLLYSVRSLESQRSRVVVVTAAGVSGVVGVIGTFDVE